MSRRVAEEVADKLSYRHNGLVIAVAQDADSNTVLMVAFMNREAVVKTLTTGLVHYWSTTRNELWLKGERSGNFQEVVDFIVDCDGDSVLLKVRQHGVACHKGFFSCFHNRVNDKLESG